MCSYSSSKSRYTLSPRRDAAASWNLKMTLARAVDCHSIYKTVEGASSLKSIHSASVGLGSIRSVWAGFNSGISLNSCTSTLPGGF